MMFGVTTIDLVVIALYLLGITYIGLRSSRGVKDSGDFFMGGRRFGKLSMMAKAFGVGTRVDHVVAVTGASYEVGLSGVWYQWLYIFSTPFYWMIGPIYRRLRYVTTGDFFEERYGSAAGMAYTLGALLFLAVEIGMMLRGTATTVEALTRGAMSADAIILIATLAFVGYSSIGGLVAAVSTKVLQGLLILVLSLLLVPFALTRVGGFSELHAKLPTFMFDLFSSVEITPSVILMMTINALVGVIAMPHHMAICGAGKSEANCRTGLTYGNIVKRFATLAWAFTGVMGAALFPGLIAGHREQALGMLIQQLLPAGLVGLMIAAMLASLMAMCDAYMVDGAALYTRNVYKKLAKHPTADMALLRIGRVSSIVIAACGVVFAFLLADVLTGLTIIWKITAFFGIPFWLAVFWKRGNRYGLWASLLVTSLVAVATQMAGWSLANQIAAYLPSGIVAFVGVSLLTPPESAEKLHDFYMLLHTPVGEEHKLKEMGVRMVLEGQSVSSANATPGIPLEEQGHSLLMVDLLSVFKKFSFRRYRVDILGFLAATLLIFLIIAATILFAKVGA
jgi:Na+/proline symporter